MLIGARPVPREGEDEDGGEEEANDIEKVMADATGGSVVEAEPSEMKKAQGMAESWHESSRAGAIAGCSVE